jgi:hypothetical protein
VRFFFYLNPTTTLHTTRRHKIIHAPNFLP